MVLSILNRLYMITVQIVDSIDRQSVKALLGNFLAGHYRNCRSLVHSCTSQELLIDPFELQRGCVKRVLCSLVHQRQQSQSKSASRDVCEWSIRVWPMRTAASINMGAKVR